MPHMEGIFINGEKAKFHPEDILDTNASQYTAEIGTATKEWLSKNITPESAGVVDKTLSIEGAAADAKETGNRISELKNTLSDVKEDIDGIVTESANLFNKNDSDSYTEGIALEPNDDTTVSYANMCTTDFIKVYLNKWYAFLGATAYYGTSNVIKVHAYRPDKTYIGLIYGVLDAETNVVKFPCNPSTFATDEGYVKISFRKSDLETFMFVEDDYPANYEEYGKYYASDKFVIPSVLSGKSISLNGDSICAGTGDSAGAYGKLIAVNENMPYQNIAVAGGTITYVSGRHCISRTMANLNQSNYVLFEGGLNDKALNVPFGEVTDGYTETLDDTTFCGAFELCCKTLVESYTTSKYGFVFVHKIATDPNWNAVWRPTMKQILDKWGVPYIDLQAEIPPLNFIDTLKNTYTNNGDGWHPNLLGYKTFYVDKITHWMKTL